MTRSFFASLTLEIAVWLATALLFLRSYIAYADAPSTVIVAHLSLLSSALLALFVIRALIWRFTASECLARWAGAGAAAFFLSLLLLYYLVVLTGLQSWNRVVSWLLIKTYSRQLTAILDSIDIPLSLASFAAVALLAGFWLLMARVILRYDWLQLTRRMSAGGFVVAICGTGSIVCAAAYNFAAFPQVRQQEPVALTFFPEQAADVLQDNTIDRNHRLIQAEQRSRREYRPNPDARRRNVILIVGDALRADHMSALGYSRPTTPFLESLVRAGKLQAPREMISVCAETSCGLLALSQSKYVYQLTKQPFNLQEVLRAHGYKLRMILGGDHTNFYGLKESYGVLDSYFDATAARGYYMNDDQYVTEHMAGLAPWDGKPVMIQFHLMSSHALGKRHDEWRRFEPSSSYSILTGSPQASRAADSRLNFINYYDNGVNQFDSRVEHILRNLENQGYMQDTLVIITADHGEELGEHGRFGHSKTVFQEVLRIPFLVMRSGYQTALPWPSGPLASQIDIAPTILTELEMPIPGSWSGEPLQKASTRGKVFFQQGRKAGFFDLSEPASVLKYWRDSATDEDFVFDISHDATEQRNLAATTDRGQLERWKVAVIATIAAQR